MEKISAKKSNFNDYRFNGLNVRQESNNYLTMERISENENKIVVKMVYEQLIKTKYGYALILDNSHIVFIKDWQVSYNWHTQQHFNSCEVLLDKNYFNVKEWGNFPEYDVMEENLNWSRWLNVAQQQQQAGNKVYWKI